MGKRLISPLFHEGAQNLRATPPCAVLMLPSDFRAVSQLLWPDKDREEWFSLEENHEKGLRFGLHQLRNCSRRPKFDLRCSSADVLRFPIIIGHSYGF
jgi:hypothetical protein